MNLVIDVGNSNVKLAIFDGKALKYSTSVVYKDWAFALQELLNSHAVKHAIVSNVGPDITHELSILTKTVPAIILDKNTKMPFENAYSTPKTLGVDRMALAAAACSQYPNKEVLVIDAGSCITYDYVNQYGTYLGGAISPGIRMRYNAIHDYTENLPLLESEDSIDPVGDNTALSIHSGIIYGVLNEIEGRISSFREEKEDLTVVLTGGDVYFLADKLKNSIFANPNFLLEGLNTILIHNIE